MSDTYRSRIETPLRILDDYELKKLVTPILVQLNNYTGKGKTEKVKEKLKAYEAGWNILTFDQNNWVQSHDVGFHTDLQKLKRILGYTLLGELPY